MAGRISLSERWMSLSDKTNFFSEYAAIYQIKRMLMICQGFSEPGWSFTCVFLKSYIK